MKLFNLNNRSTGREEKYMHYGRLKEQNKICVMKEARNRYKRQPAMQHTLKDCCHAQEHAKKRWNELVIWRMWVLHNWKDWSEGTFSTIVWDFISISLSFFFPRNTRLILVSLECWGGKACSFPNKTQNSGMNWASKEGIHDLNYSSTD